MPIGSPDLDHLGDEIAELSAHLDVGWAIDVLHPRVR